MNAKPLFEMDKSTATPAETRKAFAAGLRQLADDLENGADGGPSEQRLNQIVALYDYEDATRAVALAQDPLQAYHMAYHAVQKALFREMVRRAENGETLQVCPSVLDDFLQYLADEGKDVQIDDSAIGGVLSDLTPASPTKH